MRTVTNPPYIPFLMVVLALISLFTLSCSSPKPEDVRIGLILDKASASSETTSEGALLAIKLANDAEGIEFAGKRHNILVSVVAEVSRPEEAIQGALKLINQDHVVAIVGPNLSQNAIPVARVAENAGIPMISPLSTNPETTADKRFAFRTTFSDPFQGQVLARFAKVNLQANSAAVLFDETNAYSKGIATFFKSAFELSGGRISAFVPFTPDVKDFSSLASRIAKAKPDVVFLPSSLDQGLESQVKAMKSKGIQTHLLGSDIWTSDNLKTNPDFDGAFFADHWSLDVSTPKSLVFVNTFRQAYSRDPDSIAAGSFDAMMMLLDAIKLAGKTDPLSIRQALVDLPPYAGVSGMIDYTNSGDPIKSVMILKLTKGQALFYKQVDSQ